MGLLDLVEKRSSDRAPTPREVEGVEKAIYATPLSVKEMSKLQKKHGDFLGTDNDEALVDLIIMKVLDEAGDPEFTVAHKPMLMREDSLFIRRVAGAVLQTEDDPKN
jgi:hypothetical protein